MSTWDDGQRLVFPALGFLGAIRAGARVVAMAAVIFGFMGPMVLLRFVGFTGPAQWIVRFACRVVLRIIGIPIVTKGKPMSHPGAVVANHCSWLDIFTLNAVQQVLFVSKSEVKSWPLIGIIARSVGTVFIERRQSHAAKHRSVMTEYIDRGQRLLFFPEGTSTDGQRVLPFRSSLFAAFFDQDIGNVIWIQPVSLIYVAPDNTDPRYYCWWGDADFASHLFQVLGMKTHGRIEVVFHTPIQVSGVTDRKEMARRCENAVRSGLADTLDIP